MEIHNIFIERRKQLLEVVMIGKCVSQHRETRERGANLGIGGQDLVQTPGWNLGRPMRLLLEKCVWKDER